MKPEDDGLFPEQRLFNKFIDFGEMALDKGIASLWFSWIEWTTLTALLFVAFYKTKSFVALLAGIISLLILLFVATAACRKALLFAFNRNISSTWLFVFCFVFMICGPFFAYNLIQSIIQSILQTINA